MKNDYDCKEDDAKEAQNTTSLPFDDRNTDYKEKNTHRRTRVKVKPAIETLSRSGNLEGIYKNKLQLHHTRLFRFQENKKLKILERQ